MLISSASHPQKWRVNDYDIVEENSTRNASTILDTVVTRIRTMKQELKNLGNPINKPRRLACKECVTDTDKKGAQDKHNIPIIPGFIFWSVRPKKRKHGSDALERNLKSEKQMNLRERMCETSSSSKKARRYDTNDSSVKFRYSSHYTDRTRGSYDKI